MDSDKQWELLNDMIESGESNCCSGKVILGFCMTCKEHCETITDTE